MTTYALVKNCCPSTLVNAWKVRIGTKPFLVTPAHVCVYGERGHWTMSSFLKELSLFDWKISASYVSNPNPLYDLAWAELAKEEDECIVLGSGSHHTVSHHIDRNLTNRLFQSALLAPRVSAIG